MRPLSRPLHGAGFVRQKRVGWGIEIFYLIKDGIFFLLFYHNKPSTVPRHLSHMHGAQQSEHREKIRMISLGSIATFFIAIAIMTFSF
jgi:hypothetical protein